MTDVPQGWATEDSTDYYPERIYSRAADSRGHSERASVRLEPEILTALSRLIARQVLPDYHTISDFIRDAIYHRVKFWDDRFKGGFIPEFTAALARIETEAKRSLLAQRRELIDSVGELCAAAIRENDLATLQDAISDARMFAVQFGQPWAKELLELAARSEEKEDQLRQMRRL